MILGDLVVFFNRLKPPPHIHASHSSSTVVYFSSTSSATIRVVAGAFTVAECDKREKKLMRGISKGNGVGSVWDPRPANKCNLEIMFNDVVPRNKRGVREEDSLDRQTKGKGEQKQESVSMSAFLLFAIDSSAKPLKKRRTALGSVRQQTMQASKKKTKTLHRIYYTPIMQHADRIFAFVSAVVEVDLHSALVGCARPFHRERPAPSKRSEKETT